MSPDTGFFAPLSSDQEDALAASLRSAGYDDGAFNMAIATGEVLSYCNIVSGVANANQDQLISNAH
ncbi:hypothetical protein [Demequina sp.]|uniref:hypothetical protein n=1 Tax=Demequina sp. TaxID=2050685 RepID=UPI0025B9A08A|nr:hypothetical protein [Demequina sp.]